MAEKESLAKRQLRFNESIKNKEVLTDEDKAQQAALRAEMREENAAADKEIGELPQQARSVDDLRAKYKQMAEKKNTLGEDINYPGYNKAKKGF